MLQSFTKYAGIAQSLIGVLGATGVGPALGAGTGGSAFNILSDAALSFLGFKGMPTQQKTGPSASAQRTPSRPTLEPIRHRPGPEPGRP